MAQTCTPCSESDRLAAIDEKLDRLIELQIGQAVMKSELSNLTARVDSHGERIKLIEKQPLKLLGAIGGGVIALAAGVLLLLVKIALPGAGS